ncbi:hypothetical protein P261_00428 [Lachnospiraceae bacterium TWA4]|nr:hypothetical protein P261_00428 [Lachnospiraceae bacterium TWA4]
MKIYVIRHGETSANAKGLFQGWSDIPLNDYGKQLAITTGKQMKNIHFDKVYSSPLSRSYQTAKLLLEHNGQKNLDITIDERIKEIHIGDWEMKKFRSDSTEIPFEEAQKFFTDPIHFKGFPNGETLEDVCTRTQDFLNELIDNSADETILVSTHGCATRAMLNPLYENPKNFWQNQVPPNCAVNIVDVTDGIAKLTAKDKIYYTI